MNIPNLKARTALAATIAGVDRQRLNEAIAADFYPCAPETVRGATRVFDVNDIVCLTAYGLMLEDGMTPRMAGRLACGLREYLVNNPNGDRVINLRSTMRSMGWMSPEDYDSNNRFKFGHGVVWTTEYRLAEIRDRVISDLTEAASIVGADD